LKKFIFLKKVHIFEHGKKRGHFLVILPNCQSRASTASDSLQFYYVGHGKEWYLRPTATKKTTTKKESRKQRRKTRPVRPSSLFGWPFPVW
jgi:hypothetical protein